MSNLDATRASISATVDDIAEAHRALGGLATDPADREAFDIVSRIERRLQASSQREKVAAE